MKPITFGSVCSGIEAASVAWGPIGWRAAWLAEIEPFPSAVLAHHYPDTPNLGDMTQVARRVMVGEVPAPEVLTGGTPCQAFSVAGLRESLADERGNLTLKFVELADAIDHVRGLRGEQPATIIWENVPGVLSTKDNAFGCFLAGLAGEDDALEQPGGRWSNSGCVYGPARAVAWRTLDAQYFGVAQRRRRVFVVASARNGFDPAAVLFEFDGMRRDSAPSREAGQRVANAPTDRADRGGTNSEGQRLIPAVTGQQWPADVTGTLDTSFGPKQGLDDQHVNSGCSLFVPVTHSLRGEGFDASEDGAGRGTPLVPVGVPIHGTDKTARVASYTDLAGCLRADVPGRVENSSTTVVQQPIGFAQNQRDEVRMMEVAGALAAEPGAKQHTYLHHAMQVRRLTPEECEALQGFPRGYTAIPWRKKPAAECPDGPRYKALGNSWAVPCARWVGARVDAALRAAA